MHNIIVLPHSSSRLLKAVNVTGKIGVSSTASIDRIIRSHGSCLFASLSKQHLHGTFRNRIHGISGKEGKPISCRTVSKRKKKSATLTCKLICSCPKWRNLRRNYIFLPASTLVGTFLRRKGLLCRRRRPKSGWYDTHGNDDRYHCPGKILVNVNASPSVGRNGFPLILKPPSSHRMLLKWEATA